MIPLSYSNLINKKFVLAGPCVIESEELLDECAAYLKDLQAEFQHVVFVFKSSFDKANRTSLKSFRGPGLENGIAALEKIKFKYGLPVVSDIHESYQAKEVKDVLDIVQIPAFLCRQTDLLISAAETGLIVNLKKAQFLSGADMYFPAQKVKEAGNEQILLTERGSMYGYNNLVVDFRNIIEMKEHGYPVIFDATHSVQKPGAAGGKSGGKREYVAPLTKAANAVGADGFFFEFHPDPDKALSDGPNMLNFKMLRDLLREIL